MDMLEAYEQEIDKLTRERDEAKQDRDRLREALKGLMTRVWFACPQMDAAQQALTGTK